MKRLIIGCGYLGWRVAKSWQLAGDNVWALTRSHERAGQFQTEDIHPVVGDVMVPSSLVGLNAGGDTPFETVVFAVARDRGATVTMRDLYLQGLQNVLAHLSPLPKRFLSISSTSVYGQNEGEWVDESSVCEPTQENGRTCLDAEHLLWDKLSLHPECRGMVLRLAGIYGPGRLIARAAALQKREQIQGNPNAWLNLIHVDDAVRAVLAVDMRGKAGETYLVVDDEPLMRRDYYGSLAKLLGAPEPTFAPTDGDVPSGTNKRCSNRKLRDVLGVNLEHPTVSSGLLDALSRT